jgi:hypothetical protein
MESAPAALMALAMSVPLTRRGHPGGKKRDDAEGR